MANLLENFEKTDGKVWRNKQLKQKRSRIIHKISKNLLTNLSQRCIMTSFLQGDAYAYPWEQNGKIWNTKQERLNKLLDASAYHYDIERDVTVEGGSFPAAATYYLRDENYLITRRHVLNAVENYDYTYFYLTDELDEEILQKQIDLSLRAGLDRVKPHREHMSSFVTLVILADTITPEAKKLLQKTRFRKNFRLALHGWMEYHIAAMEISTHSFLSNPAGKEAKKTLEANFASKAQ